MSGPTFEGQRQWIVLARLGGEITAQDAAARLSVIEKAEHRGDSCPDIRDLHVGDCPMTNSREQARTECVCEHWDQERTYVAGGGGVEVR